MADLQSHLENVGFILTGIFCEDGKDENHVEKDERIDEKDGFIFSKDARNSIFIFLKMPFMMRMDRKDENHVEKDARNYVFIFFEMGSFFGVNWAIYNDGLRLYFCGVSSISESLAIFCLLNSSRQYRNLN